ncbi:LOW QUALITY PROTEIN: docking protein 2 [Rhinichthys klamathensis goyatoka]|uniref:LOW QUALITY PROTEIN: docking protein 2 n=1 Tax=Rhinichthys klamathensis goyatoka TaxID=3034132 RepID=UPI0024B5E256|nr:LOW QUALITY PROTEIN: docking protein 2 [Rhinichthys klamathensis goyatoka]
MLFASQASSAEKYDTIDETVSRSWVGDETERMEEDIKKKGMLYLQQQRFGKKWRKVWSVLYRESSCSISRLEFFECKDGTGSTLEKANRKQENKKVIKMTDCIRVSEADVEGCPRDCGPFLVETTEKTFVFAVETAELEDWIQKLCEIAFPMSWTERGAVRGNSLHGEFDDVTMADNTLYCSRETAMKDFKVNVRRTEASERCSLKGVVLLRTDSDSLLLKEPKTGEVLYAWPYRFLRRFGRDKATFSFEAGRRCDSGEGNFEFDTKQGNTIFQSVEAAINLHRVHLPVKQIASVERDPMPSSPRMRAEESSVYSMVTEGAIRDTLKQPQNPQLSRLEAPTEKLLTGVKSLNLDTRPPPRKNQVKNFRSCPLVNTEDEMYSRAMAPDPDRGSPGEKREPKDRRSTCSNPEDSDYSLPFDTIAKNVMVDILSASNPPPTLVEPSCENDKKGNVENTEPLYDIIDETAIRTRFTNKKTKAYKIEHIYDEPEGCGVAPSGPPSLYDEPEEVKGHAWKMLGTVMDPTGHEYPYNASVDDYAVPVAPRRALLSKQKDSGEEESSPYDNIMVKVTQKNN